MKEFTFYTQKGLSRCSPAKVSRYLTWVLFSNTRWNIITKRTSSPSAREAP